MCRKGVIVLSASLRPAVIVQRHGLRTWQALAARRLHRVDAELFAKGFVALEPHIYGRCAGGVLQTVHFSFANAAGEANFLWPSLRR